MEDKNYSSHSYSLREPRGKIEEWKIHAKTKYDMPLSGLIRWLMNLDMKGNLEGHQDGKPSYVQTQELSLLKERIKELEGEIELKDGELNSISLSKRLGITVSLALNIENQLNRLFSCQQGFKASMETIGKALGIPEASHQENSVLEYVLHHLVATRSLDFKGGEYYSSR